MSTNNLHPSNINFNDAWSQLKPQLDAEATRREKKKRRFIFFWFSALLVGVATGVVLYHNSSDGKKSFVKNVETNTTKSNDINEKIVTTKNNNATRSNNNAEISINNIASTNFEKTELEDNNNSNNNFVNNKSAQATSKHNFNKQNNNTNKTEGHFKKDKKTNQENNSLAINNNTISTTNENLQSDSKTIKTPINTNTLASTKTNVITIKNIATPMQEAIVTAINKSANTKKSNPLEHGLTFTAPLFFGANNLNVNANNQPLTLFIPSIYVAKNITDKHIIQLQLNPYSQYFLNNNAIYKTEKYIVTTQQGSNINTKPIENTYTQTESYNKLIGIEFGAMYQYKLDNKIKLGLGVYNNIVTGAIIQNKIVKDNATLTRNEFVGINKNDDEWKNINTSFWLCKFQAIYQFNRFNVGINISKPISNLFNNVLQNASPINTNLILQYRLK